LTGLLDDLFRFSQHIWHSSATFCWATAAFCWATATFCWVTATFLTFFSVTETFWTFFSATATFGSAIEDVAEAADVASYKGNDETNEDIVTSLYVYIIYYKSISIFIEKAFQFL
jgi:hypothetical protein